MASLQPLERRDSTEEIFTTGSRVSVFFPFIPTWVSRIPDASSTDEESPEVTSTSDVSTGTEEDDDDAANTRTDSGKTVTLPNDEVVTITSHTTILTDEIPSKTPSSVTASHGSSLSLNPDQTSLPPPGQETTPSDDEGGSSLPTGAIVGAGVGGAAVLAIIVMLVLIAKYRRKTRHSESSGSDQNDCLEEKHFPRQTSVRTTGSGDPFEPFGGRVNEDAAYPYRPATNTFEMDATSIRPVELPGSRPEMGRNPVAPVPDSGPADPRANLDSLGTDGGRPRYVNHWNQYRAMSSN